MNSTTTEFSKLGGPAAWLNWTLGVAFIVFVFTFQTGYAVTNVAITSDLKLSVVQVGFIGSIYTWAFAIAQFASGSILDRLGIRVLPIAAAVVTAGGFLFAYATNAYMLIAAQVLMALGGSFGFVGAGFVGGRWFGPLKYGFMFALVQFFASLSAIVGQKTLGSLVLTYAWSDVLLMLSYLGLAITVAMFLFMRNPKLSATDATPEWEGISKFVDNLLHDINEVAASRDAWVNSLIGGATFGSMLALGVVWGPRYLIALGFGELEAYAASSMMWLGLAIGAPIFGWISDQIRKRKLPMAAGCLGQLVVIMFIMSTDTIEPTLANILFFLWGFMAGGSILNFPIGADIVPPRLIGSSAAVVNAVQFICGGIIMAIPGHVLSGSGLIARVAHIAPDQTAFTAVDYQWALAVIPFSLVVALVLFLFLNETYPQSEPNEQEA